MQVRERILLYLAICDQMQHWHGKPVGCEAISSSSTIGGIVCFCSKPHCSLKPEVVMLERVNSKTVSIQPQNIFNEYKKIAKMAEQADL